MRTCRAVLVFLSVVLLPLGIDVHAQTAKARYEILKLIRKEKFDLILPGAMRDNDFDIWIHVIRDGIPDPLALDLGGTAGYFVFTDRGGDRIERAVFGGRGSAMMERDVYDVYGREEDLRPYVEERNPEKIAVNTSAWIPASDGLSHSGYQKLMEMLGRKYGSRLTSAENLIIDFRVRRVQREIIAFANAAEKHRQIVETALSNAVIIPGVTTREDVAWWVQDRLLEQGLGSSFGLSRPSVIYSSVSDPSQTRSLDYIFQRGDFLSFDMGVKYLNFGTDYKRNAYILRAGETSVPASIQHAFQQNLKAREIMRRNIMVGRTAGETLAACAAALEKEGFIYTPFVNTQPEDRNIINSLGTSEKSGISIDCHMVGNTGNSQTAVGAAFAPFRQSKAHLYIQPNHLFSFEYIVHTAIPERPQNRLAINFEDNHIVTERGVEWLYPPNEKIIIIK